MEAGVSWGPSCTSYFIRSLPVLLLAWEGRGAGSSGGRKGRVRLELSALVDG